MVWKVIAATPAAHRLAGSRLSGTAGSASHGVAPCPAFAYTRTNGNVQVEKE